MTEHVPLHIVLASSSQMPAAAARRAAHLAGDADSPLHLAAVITQPQLPLPDALHLWDKLTVKPVQVRGALLSRADMPADLAATLLGHDTQTAMFAAEGYHLNAAVAALLLERHAGKLVILQRLVGTRSDGCPQAVIDAALLIDERFTRGGRVADDPNTARLFRALKDLPDPVATAIAEQARSIQICTHLTRAATTDAAATNLINVLVRAPLAAGVDAGMPFPPDIRSAEPAPGSTQAAINATRLLARTVNSAHLRTLRNVWAQAPAAPALFQALRDELEDALYPTPNLPDLTAMPVSVALRLSWFNPGWAALLNTYLTGHAGEDPQAWTLLETLAPTFPGTVEELTASAHGIAHT